MRDLAVAAWVLIVAWTMLVWLPGTRAFGGAKASSNAERAGRAARAVLFTIVSVVALSHARLLTPLTFLFAYAAWPLLLWVHRQGRSARGTIETVSKQFAITASRCWEEGMAPAWLEGRLMAPVDARVARFAARAGRLGPMRGASALIVLLLAMAVTLAIVLRYAAPIRELRLGHPDGYQVLYSAQRLLAEQPLDHAFRPAPALVAGVSLLSSIHPLHVVRFLGPLVGCLLVAAVGFGVRRLTGRTAPAVVTALSLGAYVFYGVPWLTEPPPRWFSSIRSALDDSLTRQWVAGDPELAALFLILAVILWHEARASRYTGARMDTAVCLAVVALGSPGLLVIALAVAAAVKVWRPLGLWVLGGVWLMLAVVAATSLSMSDIGRGALVSLPVGLSVLSGAVFYLVTKPLRLAFGERAETALLLVAAVVLIVSMPRSLGGQYLEYDAAARAALDIVDRFPRQQWLVVAPVEQLAQTYGRGWHQELPEFVARHARRAGDPRFRFDVRTDHLFVFVEKRPFVTLAAQSMHLPFSALVDPVHRHYRSVAGRASLEFAVREICESYRRTHRDASIYYDDETLTVYHFRPSGTM